MSELCLGGILKHLTRVEASWNNFVLSGPDAFGGTDPAAAAAHAASFEMLADETLQELVDSYEAGARRSAELIASLPSLDASQPLPEAPWFQPGATWTARHAILHVLAETAQHAGHADIVREALDGQKTMG